MQITLTIGEIMESMTPIQQQAMYKLVGIVCIGAVLAGAAIASAAFLIF